MGKDAPVLPSRSTSRDEDSRPLSRLRLEFVWPATKPDARAMEAGPPGWLEDGPREMLAASLGEATRVVVELGSWLGLSTRFIADRAPKACVIAVDHWEGSPE